MGLSIETVIGLTRQPDFNCQTIGPDNSQLTCTIVIDCVWLDLCSRSAHRHENSLFMCSQRCRSWKIIVAKHFDYCRLGVCVFVCVNMKIVEWSVTKAYIATLVMIHSYLFCFLVGLFIHTILVYNEFKCSKCISE